MLIKCPKCGFSQPKDHFCARCGVDMETFKPAPQSPLARLISSPSFQIGLVLTLIGGATTFVMNRHQLITPDGSRSNVRTKAYTNSDLEQTVVANTVKEANTTASSTEASNSTASADAAPNTVAADSATAPKAEGAAALAPTAAGTVAAPAASPNSIGIRVSYTVIDNSFLNRIYEDSQGSGQFATFASYNAGLLPEIEKKLNPANTRIRVLHKVEERVEPGRTKTWFLGTKTPEGEEDVGLTTTVEFKEMDNGIFRGSFVVNRSWREKTSYPAEVEIAPQNGFFISGVLPRSLPEGTPASITSISPFDVLKDTSFRSKSAEFVIFLELTK